MKHFKQQPVTRQSDLVETVVAINRMRDIKWWHTRLRKVARRWREHLQIAYGDVSRNQSLFCSAHWVSAWRTGASAPAPFLSGWSWKIRIPASVFP
ncbi:replication endonuclease [Edwardsiella anguillarum]|nr:replication endonuclease [Edwardsiella anguillarum]